MKKKILATGIFLIFLTALSSGLTFDIDALNEEADSETPAEFEVEIQNDRLEEQDIKVTSVNAPAPSERWFDHPRNIQVSPGQTETFVLSVLPPEDAIQTSYQFKLNLRDSDNEYYTVSSTFIVDTDEDLHIQSFELSETDISPGEEITASATILNTALETEDNFVTTAKFKELSTSRDGYQLPPGASLTQEFTIESPEKSEPGEEEFKLSLNSSDSYQEVSQTVNIQKVTDTEQYEESTNYILYEDRKVVAENRGNDVEEIGIETTMPAYISHLTSFGEEPDEVRETSNGNVYVWEREVEPGQTAEVDLTVQYWIPLAFLMLVVTAFGGFKHIQNPVSVEKKVVNDGDDVKVRIEVENKTNREVEDLNIVDHVPDLAYVDRDFEMASPLVRKTSGSTELEWEIDSMKPGSQRVFEYSVNPSGISEGSITLPEAECFMGGEKEVSSKKTDARFGTA